MLPESGQVRSVGGGRWRLGLISMHHDLVAVAIAVVGRCSPGKFSWPNAQTLVGRLEIILLAALKRCSCGVSLWPDQTS